jgi:hypothetical protein
MRCNHLGAGIFDKTKRTRAFQLALVAKRVGSNLNARLLLVGCNSETCACLATTVCEYFAAACSGHTSAKPVRAKSANIVGLVRALHGPLKSTIHCRRQDLGASTDAIVYPKGLKTV